MAGGSKMHGGELRNGPPPVVLTIASFDPSSGAGITADLQVFAAFGLFGTACIAALTVQSTRGVRSTHSVSHLIPATLAELEADLPPLAVKVGMLADLAAVQAVAHYLSGYRARGGGPVVLDPVLVSSSGAALLTPEGIDAMRQELLPLVDWITPNHAELQVLSGMDGSAEAGLAALHARHPGLHIVATGGDQQPPQDILLTPTGQLRRFDGQHIATTSTHGTGCAFSSALLARLVLGDSAEQAVDAAKAFVAEAMRQAPGVGEGRGPLSLLWPLRS